MAIINQRFFKSNVTGVINLPLNGNVTLTLESNISALQPTDSKNYRIVFRADSPSGEVVARSNVITMYGNSFLSIQATGGTKTEEGNWIVHAFTGSDNFTVTALSVFPERNTFQYLAVGGGGALSQDNYNKAGGGAGGLLQGNLTVTPSYLGTNDIIVGGGGAPGGSYPGYGTAGENSVLFNSKPTLKITALGGGTGAAGTGASGGGGLNRAAPNVADGGAGTPGQGRPGFRATSTRTTQPSYIITDYLGGGGGGGAGTGGPISTGTRNGGNGLAVSWVPSSYGGTGPTPGRWFAAGGAGQGYRLDTRVGSVVRANGTDGAGYGSGNGSGGSSVSGSGGQSGIVIIRYPKG